MAEFFRKKKKVCYMCTGKNIDYKDVETLKRYINERGKILTLSALIYFFIISTSL